MGAVVLVSAFATSWCQHKQEVIAKAEDSIALYLITLRLTKLETEEQKKKDNHSPYELKPTLIIIVMPIISIKTKMANQLLSKHNHKPREMATALLRGSIQFI